MRGQLKVLSRRKGRKKQTKKNFNRYCPGFLFQGIFKISFAKTFYKIIIRIISKGKNFTSSGVPETEGAYMHPWAQAFPVPPPVINGFIVFIALYADQMTLQ